MQHERFPILMLHGDKQSTSPTLGWRDGWFLSFLDEYLLEVTP